MKAVLLIIMVGSLGMFALNILAPLVFAVWAYLRHRHDQKDKNVVDKVSVIMPLFNEEDYVVRKMDNVRAATAHLNKPVEVLMGSDGSTDKTVSVVEQYIEKNGLKDWSIFAFENEGKGRTISKLVHEAQGDLIVSTDADVSMDENALDLAVQIFEEDEHIGCLSSIPTFALEGMKSQSMYWTIELKIRDAESRMGKLIVVTGWLYAFRKALYKDIPETAMADDLWVPLSILLQGRKVVHHVDFKAYSEKTNEKTEIKRRKRVISGGADIVKRLWGQLLQKPDLFVTVFLHKINRWLLPMWCVLLFVSSLLYDTRSLWVYAALFLLGMIVLTPKRMFRILQSVFTPVFAALHMQKSKDLSKWEHTRIS